MTERVEEKWSGSVKEQAATGPALTFINQTVRTVCTGELTSVLRWLRVCVTHSLNKKTLPNSNL